jgi:ABC-type transport system substrate-binding protein
MKSLIALLAVLTVIVGCSGKKDRVSNDTFYLNLGSEPSTLNPITSSDAYSSNVQSYVLESLCERDVDTYEFKPALATSWKLSPDKTIFQFKIRKDVKWHDGKPLTVQDIKFSFDVLFDDRYNTAHQRPYYSGLKEVEILSDDEVRFYARDGYYKNFDSAAGLTIVPKHIYENPKEMKKLNKILIGTGPYKLGKYEKGKKIVLEKNMEYWGNNDPEKSKENNFKKIQLKFVKETNVALEMHKKGSIDYLGLKPEDYVKQTTGKEWGTKLTKVKTQNKAPKGYSFYGWNFKNKLFQDKRVRRALAHLVNRPMMLEKFEFGMSEYATGPQYVQSDYASKKVKPILYDPEKAAKLLKEAGWKDTDGDLILDKVIDGQKVKFSFTVVDANKEFEKYDTIFKEDAKKAGIDVQIKIVEWNSFVKLLNERKFDAVRLGWTGGGIDWEPKQIWHTSSIPSGSNFISYSNKKVDKLIDEARLIFDKSKRTKVLQKVYEMIAEDAPYAFFFNSKFTLYSHSNRIEKEKDTYNYGVGTSFWKLKK